MKDAGKIVPRERGDYDPNATYEILDFVYYNGASYVAKTTTTGNTPAHDNEYWHILVSGMDVTTVVTGVKGDSEEDYRRGEVNITKANIGLDKVQNLSPEEILDELTAENVENALGYSPSEISIEVDSALSDTSKNPVQNKVIAQNIYDLIDALSELENGQKAYTDTKIADLINGAPGTLDTLKEVADAIQENETVVNALNAAIGNKVDKVAGKGLSTNDYTTADKEKLAGLTVNNAKLTIQRNGTQVGTFTANQGTDATVDITVPTKTSELTDDAGFGSSSVTVDTEMSETSTNPVQNKVITAYINKLHGSTLHGFRINQAESDPDSMIEYIEDSAGRSPAYMDYANDRFNYGGWGSEWFIRNLKPCMLSYGGEVAYGLDKNDYTKKKNGTASDVANENFAGNAMVGVPKVFWKIVPKNENVADIFFCDENMDGTFNCWSHLDANGSEIPYCYMSIYNGSLNNGKLRGLSGYPPLSNITFSQAIDYAKANNLNNNIPIWYTSVFSDVMLIKLLLLLISKSTDSQTAFGAGAVSTYVNGANTGIINSGTMDKKGLFCGEKSGSSGVKVFGLEHFWGNIFNRVAGWVNDHGSQKIKMTYGQSDGSAVTGYNLDGVGYIAVSGATPSGTSGGYLSSVKLTQFGIIPATSSGSATTRYCDGFWFNNSQNNCAVVGGYSSGSLSAGAFCTRLTDPLAHAAWYVGASLSCKPLA